MSNRRNHRRGDKRRSEHGPRWENPNPGKGCNATHVAQARRKWQSRRRRSERRRRLWSDVADLSAATPLC